MNMKQQETLNLLAELRELFFLGSQNKDNRRRFNQILNELEADFRRLQLTESINISHEAHLMDVLASFIPETQNTH